MLVAAVAVVVAAVAGMPVFVAVEPAALLQSKTSARQARVEMV